MMAESRARQIALYGVPMLFCLAVHWVALRTWFQADDFAWLGLPAEIREFHDWMDVLFRPRAQGTVRTLSERLYFLGLGSLFGLNAPVFRAWAFLTEFVNLALLVWIARRISGSAMAAFAAAILWAGNAALSTPLDWSSAYNEICCSFFILLSFYFLLRYIDTGESKFWIAQWTGFLLGFGALELIVMYPALAALYTLLFARKYFVRTLWLFLPSALFTFLHFRYVPKTHDPNYTMYFDVGLIDMLRDYWTFALGAARPQVEDWRPVWLGYSLSIAITLAIVFLLIKRTRLTVFFLAWFLLVLLPVLPLTEHFTEYYVTIPAIGLAMLGGYALAQFPRIALPLAAVYLIVSVSDIQVTHMFTFERAHGMKRLITGLANAHSQYGRKKVILLGVSNDLFWSGFADDPFRLLGIREVYLAPGTEKQIQPHPEWGSISRFTIPLEPALHMLKSDQALVYAVGGDGSVRDITRSYAAVTAAQYLATHRDKVDVGDPLYASRLLEGWYAPEKGLRWMGKRASVQLSGPSSPGQLLHIAGTCPAGVLSKGPIQLTVSADGIQLGSATLAKPDEHFELDFALPDREIGKYAMPVTVEVNRTVLFPGDLRPLGLLFGTFTIR